MTGFQVNDIVVVRPEHATVQDLDYDYSAWARTRMKVVSVGESLIATEAIDVRPDRAWLLRSRRDGDTGDPQHVRMSWPIEQLKKIS